jgi:uncharacterized alkaline shock family protein YloU
MNEDLNLTELIESEVLAFTEVSRFADASLTENITHAVLRKDTHPSIKIATDDDGKVTISIEIIVYYGVNIPQLCYDIQSKVKRDIETNTDFTVKTVNIRVEGLDKKETN